MGRSQQDHARWLEVQTLDLRRGVAPPGLIEWIRFVRPLLQEIEADILCWLDGVADFRFLTAQYQGAVSYLDSHIGSLLAFLKEDGLYDRSTIILTSPHGEILDEGGPYFHHHTLTESCLRIPMIIKPPAGTCQKPGAKLGGIFNSLDLPPTLTEMLGLPPIPGVEGRSQWAWMREGRSLPEQDSFAVNNSETMAAITRMPYKYVQVAHNHSHSITQKWEKGDRALFDISQNPADRRNLLGDFPELAADMQAALEQYLQRSRREAAA
jgi:arylsulfatase A-like enzyme